MSFKPYDPSASPKSVSTNVPGQQPLRPQNSNLYGGNVGQNTDATLLIFIARQTAPATPTGGSFNFDTATLTPPSGWSATPITSTLSNVWMSIAYITRNAGSIIWSTPGAFYNAASGGSSVSVNGATVLNPNFQNNAASLGVDYTLSGSNITTAIRNSDVVSIVNSVQQANIGWDNPRQSVSTASAVTNLLITSAGSFYRAVVTVSGDGAAIALALNNLESNALTIGNAAKDGATPITASNWGVDGTGFQVFCNFPNTVTQAQLLTLFPAGTKSNALFYGAATDGMFVPTSDFKRFVDEEINAQTIFGTGLNTALDPVTLKRTVTATSVGSSISVNGTTVSSPNLQNNATALGVDWTIAGSNISGGLRLADIQTVANTQDAANIGSIGSTPTPSIPFSQLGGTVVSDTSNWVGASVNIASTSYAVARAALIALGAQPSGQPAGGLWTLPAAPLYVTNIASPSALQYGRVASIDEGVSTQLLIINMSSTNSYLDSLPTGSQPIFITSASFTFTNAPDTAIRKIVNSVSPSSPLLINLGIGYNADNVGLMLRTTSSTPAVNNAVGTINNSADYGAVTITSTPYPPTIPTGYNQNFIGISDSTNTLWAGFGRLTVAGIEQIAWIKPPTANSNFTGAKIWIGVNEIASVYSAIDLNTAQTVAGPVTSIITPELTHTYSDDGLGGRADTITVLPFLQLNAVTSLNNLRGAVGITSPDSSVTIGASGNNVTLTTAVPNVAGTATARNNGPIVLSNVTKTFVGANAALLSSDKGVSFQLQPLTAYTDTPQALSVGVGYGFGYNAQTAVEWDATSSLVLRSAITTGAQTAAVPGNALSTFVLSTGPTFDVTGGFPGVEADTYPGFNTANIYDRLAPRVTVTQGSGLLAPGVGQLQAWYSDGSVGGFGFDISGSLTFTSGAATLNFTNPNSLILGTSGVTRISIWNPTDGSVGLQTSLVTDVSTQFFNVTSWLPSGGAVTTGITLGSNGLADGTYTIKSGTKLIFWKAWPASIPANTLSYVSGGYIDVVVGQNLWSANTITYFPNNDQTGVLATTFSGSLTGNTLSVPTNGVDTSGRASYLKTGMKFVNNSIAYTIIGYPVTADGNRAAYTPAGSGPFAYTVTPSLASGTATLTNVVATAPTYNLTWFSNIGNVITAGLAIDTTRSYLLPQYSNWDNHVTLQYAATPSTPTLQQVTTKGNTTNQNIVFADTQATPRGVTLGAPAAVTASYALKLPPAQATAAGQVLANDGSGNLSWSAGGSGSNVTIYSTIPYKTSGGGLGFAYVDFVSLFGTDLATAQSFFPLNSTYTINRFYGTSSRPILTVTGAVTSPATNMYRVPTSGFVSPIDIYTGDAAIIIRTNSIVEFDEPLILQPSNSKVGLEFDNTLALSTTSGVLQIAKQNAASGQSLTWNGTTWSPYVSWGQIATTCRYNDGVTPVTGVSATFTNPAATVTGEVHYYLRYSTTVTPSTSTPVYRFIPNTDDALTGLSYDSFWTGFTGSVLSGLIVQRGYF